MLFSFEVALTQYALLCGSAPDGKIQKKIDSLYDSLLTENGGTFSENEIMIFPNGIDEASLLYVLNSLRMSGIKQIFLYICTVSPVADWEKTVWLGGNEIRKSLFEKPASLAGFVLSERNQTMIDSAEITKKINFSVQTVYDFDREFVSGEAYFYDAECVAEIVG